MHFFVVVNQRPLEPGIETRAKKKKDGGEYRWYLGVRHTYSRWILNLLAL
jgi:hypothetical protein